MGPSSPDSPLAPQSPLPPLGPLLPGSPLSPCGEHSRLRLQVWQKISSVGYEVKTIQWVLSVLGSWIPAFLGRPVAEQEEQSSLGSDVSDGKPSPFTHWWSTRTRLSPWSRVSRISHGALRTQALLTSGHHFVRVFFYTRLTFPPGAPGSPGWPLGPGSPWSPWR